MPCRRTVRRRSGALLLLLRAGRLRLNRASPSVCKPPGIHRSQDHVRVGSFWQSVLYVVGDSWVSNAHGHLSALVTVAPVVCWAAQLYSGVGGATALCQNDVSSYSLRSSSSRMRINVSVGSRELDSEMHGARRCHRGRSLVW